MFCRYCGSQIEDDAVFCSKCGKAQTDKLQINKTNNKVSNRNHILLFIILALWGLLILSYFLPWQAISAKSIKNNIRNDVVSEFGEFGGEIADYYMDEVLQLSDINEDITIAPTDCCKSMDKDAAIAVLVIVLSIATILIILFIKANKKQRAGLIVFLSTVALIFTFVLVVFLGRKSSYIHWGSRDNVKYYYGILPTVKGHVAPEIIENFMIPQIGSYLAVIFSIGLFVVSVINFKKCKSTEYGE